MGWDGLNWIHPAQNMGEKRCFWIRYWNLRAYNMWGIWLLTTTSFSWRTGNPSTWSQAVRVSQSVSHSVMSSLCLPLIWNKNRSTQNTLNHTDAEKVCTLQLELLFLEDPVLLLWLHLSLLQHINILWPVLEGRWVNFPKLLRTSPQYLDYEIWEPQTPGTLWACSGL